MPVLPAADSAQAESREIADASARDDVAVATAMRTFRGNRRRYRPFDSGAPDRPQTIIIWGERARLPDAKPSHIPDRLVFVAKIAALAVLLAGLYWGPAYVTCRQLKDRGLFYYGTTMSGCIQERIAARTNPFEEITKHILPVL